MNWDDSSDVVEVKGTEASGEGDALVRSGTLAIRRVGALCNTSYFSDAKWKRRR